MNGLFLSVGMDRLRRPLVREACWPRRAVVEERWREQRGRRFAPFVQRWVGNARTRFLWHLPAGLLLIASDWRREDWLSRVDRGPNPNLERPANWLPYPVSGRAGWSQPSRLETTLVSEEGRVWRAA